MLPIKNQKNQLQEMEQAKAAIRQKMQGMMDARGQIGELARGTNVYNGGSPAAHSGGGQQFGPPEGNQNAAAQQRDVAMKQMAMQRSQGGGAPAAGGSPTGHAEAQAGLQRMMGVAKQQQQLAQFKERKQAPNQGIQNALRRRMSQKKQQGNVSDAATRIRNAYTKV